MTTPAIYTGNGLPVQCTDGSLIWLSTGDEVTPVYLFNDLTVPPNLIPYGWEYRIDGDAVLAVRPVTEGDTND